MTHDTELYVCYDSSNGFLHRSVKHGKMNIKSQSTAEKSVHDNFLWRKKWKFQMKCVGVLCFKGKGPAWNMPSR